MVALERVFFTLAMLSCVPVLWTYLSAALSGEGSANQASEVMTAADKRISELRSELEHLKFSLETSSVPKRKFDKLKEKALQISGDLLRVRSEVEKYKEDAKTALAQGRVLSKKDTASAAKLNATFMVSLQRAKSQIDKYKEHTAQLEFANERLEQQLTKATQEMNAKAEAVDKSSNDAHASQEELIKLRAEVERLRRERDQARTLHDEALTKLQQMPETGSSEGPGAIAAEGADVAGDILEFENDEALKCEDSLREMKSLAKALKQKQQSLEAERDHFRAAASEAREQADHAEESLSELRAKVEKLKQDNKQRGKALADVKAKLQEVQSASASLSSGPLSSASSPASSALNLGGSAEEKTLSSKAVAADSSAGTHAQDDFASIGFGGGGGVGGGGGGASSVGGAGVAGNYQQQNSMQYQQQQQQQQQRQQNQQMNQGSYPNQMFGGQQGGYPAGNGMGRNGMGMGMGMGGMQQQWQGNGLYGQGMGQPMMGMGGGMNSGGFQAGLPQAGGPGGMNFGGGGGQQGAGMPCNQARNFEFDSDRPGIAFHSQAVRSARECRKVCESDYRCRSWVYTKADAMCFLKEVQNPSQPSACCVSGLKCT